MLESNFLHSSYYLNKLRKKLIKNELLLDINGCIDDDMLHDLLYVYTYINDDM